MLRGALSPLVASSIKLFLDKYKIGDVLSAALLIYVFFAAENNSWIVDVGAESQ